MKEVREIPVKIHIIAGSFIPYGSWYGPVQKIDFLNDEIQKGTDEFTSEIKINAEMGTLQPETYTKRPWYYYLQAARDIHEQNLNITRSRDGNLYLRSTREIDKREVIKCWYDEGLAWEMNIPYLTPANILGIGKYCCIRCQKEFSFPNHLKLHIMHKCSEFENFKCSNYDSESTKSSPFSIPTRPPFNSASLVTKHFPSDTFYTSDKKPDAGCLPHTHESRVKDSCLTRYTLKASFELVPNMPTYAILHDRKQYQTERREHFDNEIFVTGSQCKKSQYLDIDEEEPIEILRKSCSIMTSSKGHLCVFCGKLYSRKYGLKIHLRTHTGYKPLKCKICLRAFGDPSNLNKHIRLHAQGNTPYQCTYCGKILVRRRDLVRHLKSRHPNEVLS